MADYKALNDAAKKAGNITGGSLDYLIVNGALVDRDSQKYQSTEFIGREEQLRKEMVESLDVNVVGVIYSVNAFLPLIREGSVKKITVISTGMADTEMVVKHGVPGAITYSSMKAATNMVVAKYAVELRSEGITLLALSPGLVNTRETPRTYSHDSCKLGSWLTCV
jgi:NAD(P)-dependent dehydrogenase (short-subunit alcohol dehydrogenase family)